MKFIKKTLIIGMIIIIFVLPVWLGYMHKITVVNPNTGETEKWTLKTWFGNGEFKQSKRAEVYHNDCGQDLPRSDDDYIEYQFGDIRLKYPCSVNRAGAGLMLVGDNDGFQKHYYFELDFKWSEDQGLVWWNNLAIKRKYNEHKFDLYARLIIKKNSLLTKYNEAVIYKEKQTFNKKLLKSASLIETIPSANILIYEIPWEIQNSKYKQILIQLNELKDEKGNPVVLSCSTIDKNFDVLGFIKSKKKIKTMRDKQMCFMGWNFTPTTYLKIHEINLSHALNLNEIYSDLNAQLKEFVVTSTYDFN